MGSIKEAIQKLAGNSQPQIVRAKVTAVDASGYTIDCQPLRKGAEIKGVNLKPKSGSGGVSYVVIPKNQTDVIVAMLDGNDADWHLIHAEEIDEIEVYTSGGFEFKVESSGDCMFNGGSNGGLINISGLVGKLNALEQDINIAKAIWTAFVPVLDPELIALKTAITPWASAVLTPTVEADFEDTKVKH